MTSVPRVEGSSDASAVLRFDTMARLILAVTVIVQFVALVSYINWSGRQMADSQLIIGAEISFVSVILGYYFGSSSGSVTKSAKGEPPGGEPPKGP